MSTSMIMEAHDQITRPYMTEEWALDWELQELEQFKRTEFRDRRFFSVYVFDGLIYLSCQMAAFLQYRSKSMFVIYFAGGTSQKRQYGEMIKINRIQPGDI